MTASTPRADAAMTTLPFMVVLARRERKGMENRGQVGGLDRRTEDFLQGFDALGADLGGELHRQLGALDRHHGGRRIRRLPGRQLLRRRRGVLLERVELTD